jgi:DNA/RNA-binding domain of Phe-tRNA-synthetase-like protein
MNASHEAGGQDGRSRTPDAGRVTAAAAAPDAAPIEGWCAADVREELPSLRLVSCTVQVHRAGRLTGDSPPDVEARLRAMSSRVRGGRAVSMRREPVPAAYRVFFRQIGMDPDVDRTPIEAAVLERMLRGGFPTGGLLEDVLLLALIDTGVPVWALRADALRGPLGIRTSVEDEPLGRSPAPASLPHGRLVVADSENALAVLFGEIAPGHQPAADTRELVLFSVLVAGVPELYVEEALWLAQNALEAE